MPINIGKEIQKVAKQKRMGATELAKLISKSRQNVNDIYTRKAIDGDLLLIISRVLNFDFFSLYTEEWKYLTGLDSAQYGNWPVETSVSDPLIEYQKKEQTLQSIIDNQAKVIALLEEKLATKKTQ